MPVKKITAKKKKAIKRVKPVGNDSVITALQDLQASEGWAILVNNLEANVKYLEMQIVDKVDSYNNEITEEEVDRLRDKREFMRDLLKTPQTFINQLANEVDTGSDHLDPYHTDIKEMNAQHDAEFQSLSKPGDMGAAP